MPFWANCAGWWVRGERITIAAARPERERERRSRPNKVASATVAPWGEKIMAKKQKGGGEKADTAEA